MAREKGRWKKKTSSFLKRKVGGGVKEGERERRMIEKEVGEGREREEEGDTCATS